MQEIIQADYKETLVYELRGEEGPDHNKTFTVAAVIGEEELSIGKGRTKKAAEQAAAYQAILKFKSKQNR